MPEIIGMDHIFITVSDMARSERFYDEVMLGVLQFRKNTFAIGSEAHVHYYNRHFGFVLRPARVQRPHEPYSPGLHHLCLRVDSVAEVAEVARQLKLLSIAATVPKLYPEYAEDYTATFFEDPDGIRLEVMNFRQERRDRHDHWDELGV